MSRQSIDDVGRHGPGIDESTYYEDLFLRTNLLLSKDMQHRLRDSHVAIIGLGGIGGIASEMMARCGIGDIGLSDIDRYEPSNLNRQLFATFSNAYGPNRRKKAHIAKQRIKQINPFSNVEVIADGIDNRNVEAFCRTYDCIICQPDRESVKVLVHRIAKAYSIPVVTASRTHGNGNRWTITAKVWDYRNERNLQTFEETNHPALLAYSLDELTEMVLDDYDREVAKRVKDKWREIVLSGNASEYGLIEQTEAVKTMEMYPEIFHKCQIVAPIANIAGCMASIEAIKLLLGIASKPYAVNLWNGDVVSS